MKAFEKDFGSIGAHLYCSNYATVVFHRPGINAGFFD